MKIGLVIVLCALAAIAIAVPTHKNDDSFDIDSIITSKTPNWNNILEEILLRQLFEFLLCIINNGWPEHGVPVLDPLNIDEYHLVIPAGIINLDLQLEKVHASGFNQFVVNKSKFHANEIALEVDISFPKLDISAGKYDLTGDFFTTLPLYGAGKAQFLLEDVSFKAKLYLKQSEDGKSALIDKIESSAFVIPNIKTNLTGVIGGGDIDAIVNEITDDVVFDYVNRFQGAIAMMTSRHIPIMLNPFLAKLDTWRYVSVLLPHQ